MNKNEINKELLNKKSKLIASFVFENKLYVVYDNSTSKEESMERLSFSHNFFFIQFPQVSKILKFLSLPNVEKQEVSLTSKKALFCKTDLSEIEGSESATSEKMLSAWKGTARHTEDWRTNSKIFFIFFKNGLMNEEVAPERIHPWQLKERLIAAKKLKDARESFKMKDRETSLEYQVINLEETPPTETEDEKALKEILKDLDIVKALKIRS
ncbi:MAG: hypothetical protein HKM07_03900 [Chlamydiae bacterium]|nr:hypothetical protein [Chlamydiota bacterium]